MIRALEEYGRWTAFRADCSGKRISLKGYGSSKKTAIEDFYEQQSAVTNQKEFTSRW